MQQLLVLLGLSVFLISCQSVTHKHKGEDENKLTQLSWMLGKWQMQTSDGTITEEWNKSSDSQWYGVSFMVSTQGDTPFRESIKLNYNNDQLTYSPMVSNQNDAKEISFAEKSFSDSMVVFENLNHDFPQRIIYRKISDTSILAAIEGVQNGQTKSEEFAYSKR
ncbi:MAG TPA: DUF6265 family protein [Flavipsychrobacter sp.]|nr:DUF6265 family protein [Flavipsychrobacter sp.]